MTKRYVARCDSCGLKVQQVYYMITFTSNENEDGAMFFVCENCCPIPDSDTYSVEVLNFKEGIDYL